MRDRVLQRALLFENLTVSPGTRPHRLLIRVTLSYRGQTETAEEEASDTPRSRVEGAARASIMVLDRLLTESSVALEGAKIVEAFDREFAFVAVQGLGGRETILMTGTSEIKESAERAAVFAVLDATNRWTEAQAAGLNYAANHEPIIVERGAPQRCAPVVRGKAKGPVGTAIELIQERKKVRGSRSLLSGNSGD